MAEERCADLGVVRYRPEPDRMVVLLEASIRPSGLKATLRTKFVWPLNGVPICCPLLRSQSRIVPSLLPAARVRPFGPKATAFTEPV